MLFTDCFGEEIQTNTTFFYVPHGDKLTKSGHVVQRNKHTNDLSHIQVAVLALGHNDIRTLLGPFMCEYKKIIKSLLEHNSNMFIIMCSVLPLGPDENQSWHFAYVKTQSLITQLCRKQSVAFYSSFDSLNVNRVIPAEFQRSGKLVGMGVKLFMSGLSKFICTHPALQME